MNYLQCSQSNIISSRPSTYFEPQNVRIGQHKIPNLAEIPYPIENEIGNEKIVDNGLATWELQQPGILQLKHKEMQFPKQDIVWNGTK